jgi:hypothetical protein
VRNIINVNLNRWQNVVVLVGVLLGVGVHSRPLGAEDRVAAPGATKPCFNCGGSGEAKCPQPGCTKGRVDCPGPCLKLHKGVWEKRNVPGHDPNELWQKVRLNSRQTSYVSSGHVGQCFVAGSDGNFTPVVCKTCNGATTLECSKCKGKGTAPCSICDGKKVVPAAWSAFDHPRLKDRPKRFELKDGRVLIGRSVMVLDSTVKIRTEKGDVQVEKADIVSERAQPSVR